MKFHDHRLNFLSNLNALTLNLIGRFSYFRTDTLTPIIRYNATCDEAYLDDC